jgi:ribosomal protein S18 acetylase RimI-like enzyme
MAYIIKNIDNNYNKDILDLGRLIFNAEDDVPLLEKALTLYVKELSYVVIEKDKNQMAGFILVCKKYTKVYHKFMNSIPNCYEIAFLGIHPSYQGKGLGYQCLRQALLSIFKICRQFNAWLIVNADNIGAIKLYKKLGFIQWKYIPHDKYPSYIMGISHRRYLTNIKI